METRRDVFQAIADPTRRKIITLVARNPQNITSLADRFDMSRQAISLHIKILEKCGVLSIAKEGRERRCTVRLEKFSEVSDWIEPFLQMWEGRFNQLDNVLFNLKANQK